MFLWYFTFAILFRCNLTVAEQIESENAKVIGCNDETGLKQGANYFDFFSTPIYFFKNVRYAPFTSQKCIYKLQENTLKRISVIDQLISV